MAGRTKVLFITHDMRSGGVERIFSEVLRCLDPEVFELHLALHRTNIAFPVAANVTIHEIGLRAFWQVPSAILALRRLLRTVKPDLVVPGAINPCLVLGEALRLMAARPASLAMIVANTALEPGWRQPWARRAYRVMDSFLSLSHDLKDLSVATYDFIEAERIQVWNTGLIVEDIVEKAAAPIDTSLFDKPVLVAVARLYPVKRFDIMIDSDRDTYPPRRCRGGYEAAWPRLATPAAAITKHAAAKVRPNRRMCTTGPPVASLPQTGAQSVPAERFRCFQGVRLRWI